MTGTADALKSQLAELPTRDRAELARYLIESLESDPDAGIDAAWESELLSRLEEMRNGTGGGASAEEVFRDLREKYT
ncbi:MAG: addiction module protein [Planctomycetales bacterium]